MAKYLEIKDWKESVKMILTTKTEEQKKFKEVQEKHQNLRKKEDSTVAVVKRHIVLPEKYTLKVAKITSKKKDDED